MNTSHNDSFEVPDLEAELTATAQISAEEANEQNILPDLDSELAPPPLHESQLEEMLHTAYDPATPSPEEDVIPEPEEATVEISDAEVSDETTSEELLEHDDTSAEDYGNDEVLPDSYTEGFSEEANPTPPADDEFSETDLA